MTTENDQDMPTPQASDPSATPMPANEAGHELTPEMVVHMTADLLWGGDNDRYDAYIALYGELEYLVGQGVLEAETIAGLEPTTILGPRPASSPERGETSPVAPTEEGSRMKRSVDGGSPSEDAAPEGGLFQLVLQEFQAVRAGLLDLRESYEMRDGVSGGSEHSGAVSLWAEAPDICATYTELYGWLQDMVDEGEVSPEAIVGLDPETLLGPRLASTSGQEEESGNADAENGTAANPAGENARTVRSADTDEYGENFAAFAEEDREAKIEILRQELQELRDNLHRVEELTGVDMESVFERLLGMNTEDAAAAAPADEQSRTARSAETEATENDTAAPTRNVREARMHILLREKQELMNGLHQIEESADADVDPALEYAHGQNADDGASAAPADEQSRTARSTDTEDAGEQAVAPAQGERVLRMEDLPQDLQDFRESMLRVEEGTGVDMEAVFERLMSVYPEYWTQPDSATANDDGDGGSSRARRSADGESEAPISAENVCGPEGQSDALSVFPLEDWTDERIDAILDRVLGPEDESAAENADFVWTVEELAGVVDTAYSMLNEVGCPITT